MLIFVAEIYFQIHNLVLGLIIPQQQLYLRFNTIFLIIWAKGFATGGYIFGFKKGL